jgi:hypothetical protein
MILFGLIGCKDKNKITKDSFIGTWHLVSISDGFVDKGLIMYSSDGQMSAILSKNDSMLLGYSGKYEINLKESYVTHFRDFYSTLPYPSKTKTTKIKNWVKSGEWVVLYLFQLNDVKEKIVN